MKASTGASIVILRQQIESLQKKLRAQELVTEATLTLHQNSVQVANEILRKLATSEAITAKFAAWYAKQIKQGSFDRPVTGAGPVDIEELEEFMAMFSQQHYEALAEVLRETRIEVSKTQTGSVASIHDMHQGISTFQKNLMKLLAKDNPKFKDLIFVGAASEHSPAPNKKTRR